jgi:hypothetical protein
MEVIIALGIMGMSMAAIGTLVQIGGQNALEARLLTTAQFLAESKLSEVKAGILSPTATGPLPFPTTETMEPFQFTIRSQSIDSQGMLLAVEILVEYLPADGARPIQHSVTTWMIDPAVELAPEANEQLRDILTLEDI